MWARLWREHRLFVVVAALSVLPRLLAALAFRPALFTPDSFGYLREGTQLFLGQLRPAGYPLLLRLLEPFHSLLLVTTVQHLLGIAVAAVVYAVLRHWGLPAWGAVLAALPTLFDSRQIMLESVIWPDTLYVFLIILSVALLLTRRTPAWWQCLAAGSLAAWFSVVRGNGLVAGIIVVAFLFVRRVGWRALAAGMAGFAVPVLAYMTLFWSHYGTFSTTSGDGFFLWSRTMSFANCAVIKPPTGLRPLCPDRQPHHPAAAAPAWSVPSLLRERSPAQYLWDPGAWWRHDQHPGINAYNNRLARQFALDAIRAQPLGYARTVAKEVMLTFLATDRSLTFRTLHFTSRLDVPALRGYQERYLRGYAHTISNTRQVQPYAYFLSLYQLPVYVPGILLLAVLLAGLAGVIRQRRHRGGPGALPWAIAAAGIVTPIALHEYHYRYVITAVPLACLAAGLAFAHLPECWAGRAGRADSRPRGAHRRDTADAGCEGNEGWPTQAVSRSAGPVEGSASQCPGPVGEALHEHGSGQPGTH